MGSFHLPSADFQIDISECFFKCAKCAYCLCSPSAELPFFFFFLRFAVNFKPETDNFFSAESLVIGMA